MALFICQGCGAEHGSWGGKCPNCGTSETIRLAPMTDRMVDRVIKGKFKIVRKLGQGGMGAVYLAEQLGIGHRVALKFLKSEFSTDAEIARRFLNEAKSYARVAHPNAVALHDFGQDDEGNLFIAMEYCEGVDLKKIIAEQGRLPLVEGIEVVLQVADVLANAHEKGVIHRDLKPENIMIRRGIRGVHAKVLDFGIARLMDAGTKLTVAGAIAGTPRYMSPEQVEGKEVDHRADVYSLGICLFEAITGHQPFDGTTITEILRKQVGEPLPRLNKFGPDLDYPEIDAVLQRACAKKFTDRWPDMLAFASALSQAIPTQAHLSLPPLQRTNVGIRAVATPAPGALTDLSPSGATMTDVGTDDRTLMRGDSSPPSQPLQLTQPVNAVDRPLDIGRTTLDHSKSVGTATQVGDTSSPPVAPRSKTPLYVMGAIAAVLAVTVVVVAMRPPPETVKPQDPPVAKVDPPPTTKVDPPPTDPTAQQVALADATRVLEENNANNNLSTAKGHLKNGDLDAADTFLKVVKEGTSAFAEAKQLLEQSATIRAKVAEGQRQFASGNCAGAAPQFKAALDLNPNIAAANAGLAKCRNAALPTSMDP